MISSFFIKSLQEQPMLVHGTSPRYYEVYGGKKEPLFPFDEDRADFFVKHQTLFLESLGVESEVFFHLHQVHSNIVYVLKDPKVSPNEVGHFAADAIVTHLTQCPIVVLTADCVPIVIYDPVKNVIGVVHAGRMGTKMNIFNNTIETLSREYDSNPKDLIVGMGPAIRGCCYELEKHCASPFMKRSVVNSGFIKKVGSEKYFLDLPGVNLLEGSKAGILKKNIYIDGPCTSCNNQQWYSYRKEKPTGRLVTLAMLRFRK